jgi:thioesterase
VLLSERPATAPGAATATAVRPGAGRWFQGAAPRPGAALRVVCFPHAGGTPSLFHD